MHPSIIFALWLFVVLLLQVSPLSALVALLLSVFSLSSQKIRVSFFQLMRRSRWILLTLVMTFVLLTPGEKVWPDYPFTKEGLSLGLDHLLRLLAVLMAVAWLVGGRSMAWILSALLGLIHALNIKRATGFVVRLALTLQYVAGDFGRQSWRTMLLTSETVNKSDDLEYLDLSSRPLAVGERFLTIGLLCGGVLILVAYQ